MELQAEQKDRYARDGYLLLPGMFGREQVDRYIERFLALVRGEAAAGESMVIMRDVMVAKGVVEPETPVHAVNKVLSFEDDEVLFDYAIDHRLLSAVRSLIGPRVMTISTNVFNKPPGVDGRHPLHQDLRYFSLRPEQGIIGTWTALGEVSRANGCLAVIPGSHRSGLLEHQAPDWDHVNGGFLAAKDIEVDRRVHVEMEAGDTLLLHPLLVHGSGRNESSDFRRAISVHYASQECIWPSGRSRRALVVSKIDSPLAG